MFFAVQETKEFGNYSRSYFLTRVCRLLASDGSCSVHPQQQQTHRSEFVSPTHNCLVAMARLREEINSYLSIPGTLCMVAGGWLYLAANHCNDEARRVSQAYVLDSLSGRQGCDCLSVCL